VSAMRTVGRLAGRYKLAVVIGAAFIVAIVAISVTAGNGSSASASRQDRAAPGFSVTALGNTGRQISLSQYAGKPVIVNFWASWCEPCKKETPLLARWYKQQHGKVNLIGLDENDTAASALKFARGSDVTYTLGFDPLIKVADAYGVEGAGIPQTFFLNARHQIVDHVYGAVTTASLAKGVRLMNQPA
jgi:cytochrome c biogenesis protein CcmG, thiol:disulfide interchange protein DsbE